MLWIPITIAAAGFQVARNALQRGLMGDAGPWGATLVRFLFGLPFSLALWAAVAALTPGVRLSFSASFWIAVSTAARKWCIGDSASTAWRIAFSEKPKHRPEISLPLSAVIGLAIFHDNLTGPAWVGVGFTTVGLAVLTWPKGAGGPQPLSGALFGLISGLCFGFSLNAMRHAVLALSPMHHFLAAVAAVSVAQAMQSAALTAVLAWRRPQALRAVAASWRQSLGAGLCGAIASFGWFAAIGFSPAGPVRAVGMVEMPMAAIAGRRMFAERLTPLQWAAGVTTAFGVVLAALG
jgi:EamA domain-containing membrane protein RarD